MTVISGDAIRMMNYVDDISATLRRIVANVPAMNEEERKRVAEYIRNAQPNISGVLQMLEKGVEK
ncbi:MAG: hypothetical protein JOZ43_02050 [Acidobacteriales bacterium]|nr:hypothetical protein [Terriglobales bacterium]